MKRMLAKMNQSCFVFANNLTPGSSFLWSVQILVEKVNLYLPPSISLPSKPRLGICNGWIHPACFGMNDITAEKAEEIKNFVCLACEMREQGKELVLRAFLFIL